MRRRGRCLLCPARLSVHRRVNVGQARVPGLYRVVLVRRVRQVAVRPGRGAWLALRVAGCLRAQSLELLPVASWRVPALQRVKRARQALQR